MKIVVITLYYMINIFLFFISLRKSKWNILFSMNFISPSNFKLYHKQIPYLLKPHRPPHPHISYTLAKNNNETFPIVFTDSHASLFNCFINSFWSQKSQHNTNTKRGITTHWLHKYECEYEYSLTASHCHNNTHCRLSYFCCNKSNNHTTTMLSLWKKEVNIIPIIIVVKLNLPTKMRSCAAVAFHFLFPLSLTKPAAAAKVRFARFKGCRSSGRHEATFRAHYSLVHMKIHMWTLEQCITAAAAAAAAVSTPFFCYSKLLLLIVDNKNF